MDYQEFNKCVEILQNKPKWFFQKDHIQIKMECLEKFKSRGAPTHITSLVSFLRDDNEELRLKIAETIITLFNRLKSQNQLYDSLKYTSIKMTDIDYYKISFPKEIYVVLLGIASFNHNGYVREKAVEALKESKNINAVKYILLRLSDWVKPIREEAKKTIQSFFNPFYIEAFLKELALIDSLQKIKRTNLSVEYDSILQFLVSRELTNAFYKQLDINDNARLLYVRHYLKYRGVSLNTAQIIIADKYFLIRKEILKYLDKFNQSEQERFISGLLRDSSYQVRQNALYAINNNLDGFENIVFQLTSDNSASIRDLARYLLRNKNHDFHKIYKERIFKKEMIVGSILGLSEVGSNQELTIFSEYITHSDSRIKLACLHAINLFDTDTAKTYSLSFLTHRSNKIRNKCIEILAKTWDEEVRESTNRLYELGDYEQRKSILRLTNKVGGWDAMPGLILAVSDADNRLQNLAWFFLQKWIDKALRLFTNPPENALKKAKEYYDQTNASKMEMTPYQERLWLELKYYLTR